MMTWAAAVQLRQHLRQSLWAVPLLGAVAGGALAVVNTDSSIAKTFEITGLDQIFTIVPSRADAFAALDDAIEGDAA